MAAAAAEAPLVAAALPLLARLSGDFSGGLLSSLLPLLLRRNEEPLPLPPLLRKRRKVLSRFDTVAATAAIAGGKKVPRAILHEHSVGLPHGARHEHLVWGR